MAIFMKNTSALCLLVGLMIMVTVFSSEAFEGCFPATLTPCNMEECKRKCGENMRSGCKVDIGGLSNSNSTIMQGLTTGENDDAKAAKHFSCCCTPQQQLKCYTESLPGCTDELCKKRCGPTSAASGAHCTGKDDCCCII